MRCKVLILGAYGMLGHKVLSRFLDSDYKILCQTRSKNKKTMLIKKLGIKKRIDYIIYDVEKDNFQKLENKLKNGDIIINCIGKIKPYIKDDNNAQIKRAIKINSIFPIQLSDLSIRKKIKIYQIATDCVYNGKKGNYSEDDLHDAIDVYGKTKSLGEAKTRYFYNLRSSIIGQEITSKNSLVEWFKSCKKNKFIFGFNDHQWNGLSTSVFSELLFTIIDKKIKIPNLINIIPADKVNKYILMTYLKKFFNFKNLKIKKKNSNSKINRVLETKYKDVNNLIWRNSKYKKTLTIKEIVSTL